MHKRSDISVWKDSFDSVKVATEITFNVKYWRRAINLSRQTDFYQIDCKAHFDLIIQESQNYRNSVRALRD